MNETNEDCLVYFEDYKVIGNILQRRHELRGKLLDVKCFQPALGRAEGEKKRLFQVPRPIEVQNINSYKVTFVANSEDKRNAVEKEMCKHYVQIKWPSSNNQKVQLVCTLTENVKGNFKIAREWGKQAHSKFVSLIDGFVFHRVEILHDIKKKVIDFLKAIHIANPSNVAIITENDQRTIIIVGQKGEANALKDQIEGNVKKIIEEEEKERHKVKDTLTNLTPVEVKLLQAENFSHALENDFQDLNVHVNAENCEISFEGMIGSVQGAKLKTFEKKCSLVSGRLQNVSNFSVTLYQSEKVIHFIQKKLKAEGVIAVWDVSGTSIDICCTKQEMYERCEQVIRESVLEEVISLQKGEVPDLKTKKWKSKVDEINSLHPGKVKINVNDSLSKVGLSAASDIMSMILTDVKSFLKSHRVIRKKVIHSKQAHRLIEKYNRHRVEEIKNGLRQYFVDITFLEQYGGFEISGLERGVQDAYILLLKLLKSIKQKHQTVSKPGIAEHVRSSKGKDSISTIETNLSCVIVVEGDEAFEQMSNRMHGSGVLSTCKVFDVRNICAWQGDMTELAVDMIINPSDKNLRFVGGLGKAILSKGGKSIQYECEDYVGNYGVLQDDDVFIGRGGNLKAKHIAHIKSQEWKQDQDKEKILETSVFRCLQEASKLQVSSIAIPAIGCGANGFPVEVSTTCIVNALRKVFLEYQDSTVTEVYLSDMNTKNVTGFTNALVKIFGKTCVMINDDDISSPPKTNSMNADFSSMSSTDIKQDGPHNDDTVVIGNTVITLIKGEIAKQKADVIVNTTSFNLDLRNGTVSQTLLKAAGTDLQKEVKSNYPNGLKKLDFAVTGGHNLACRVVIHTALSNYNDKKPKDGEEAIYKLVYNCLTETQQRGYSSIVFPAVGTGNLGYPRHIVARHMFHAVSSFSNTYPQSSINDVKFVVYHMDKETISAFEKEQSQLKDAMRSKTYIAQSDTDAADVIQGINHEVQTANDVYTFGNITVTVHHGDLLSEDVDCIVNSTNEDLNLAIGTVSKIILEKGGLELREELGNHKEEIKARKITVTLAPGLSCKNIVHVVTDTKDLTGTVQKCLTEAEDEMMTSIAFPALGTGALTASNHTVAAEVAKNMVSAVKDFADNMQPRHLMDVRFVMLQREMLAEFQKAVETRSDPKSWFGKAAGNVWKGFKNVFGMTGTSNKSDKKLDEEIDFNSVSFVIMAFSDNVIRKAIQQLESSIEKEIYTKTIDDHVIPLLEDTQVQEMYGISKQWRVEMTMNKNKGIIQISGIVSNVMNASEKISGLIRDAERMELMQNIAQWFFIEVTKSGQEVKPYERDINLAIETAYRQKKDILGFLVDGVDYILDFESMEEYPENDKTDKVKVIRRDLVKGIGIFEPPPEWDDMQGGNLRVVEVKQGTPEYTNVETKFQTSCGNKQFQVVKMERIQNKTLWEQYQSKKKQLETQNPPTVQNERELWHGTSVEPVYSINAHGFNRSYCGKNATVYGDGVYFAKNASYSCQDTYSRPDSNQVKRMYLCRVLTGEYAKGEKGMRVLPAKPSGGAHALYDSVTNDVNNPSMFIIYHDTQAYAEYMLYFKA